MNQLINRTLFKRSLTNVITAAFLVGAFSVSAATTPENTDDGSAIGTSDTPQIKQQDKRIDKKATNKSMKKNTMNKHSKDMQMMDTDNNGMVSREEYMNHHEQSYGKMEQGEGGVSYKSSMNNKPIGTTSGVSKNGSVDVTKEGPVNGTTTGTN